MLDRRGSVTRYVRIAACVVSAGSVALFDVPAAGAGNHFRHDVTCGTVVTRDIRLHSDLIDCPADGLLVGADDIEIDLNGHTIDGIQTGLVNSDADGVDNSAGHRGVTIRDGAIQQFASGAYLDGAATDNHLVNLDVSQDYVGIDVANATDNLVECNQSHDNGLAGIRLLVASDNEVTGNDVANSTFGIFLDNADGNQVDDNTVQNSEADGIDLFRGSDGNSITDNVVRNAASAGMQISDATNNRFVDNIVTSSPTAFGMALLGGGSNVVKHNSITDNPNNPGLYLIGSSDNEVRSNDSSGNDVGIAVISGSTGNVLVRNVTSKNGNVGIGVGGFGPASTGTVVRENVARRNTDSGIVVREPGSVVARNVAYRNGNLGIDASAGVIDGDGNRAAHNGNPLQCSGVQCSDLGHDRGRHR